MKRNFTVRRGALDGVEAFLEVARHRNFRRAAAKLGVTPSAIGQTVRALESRLGATLFTRTTRSVGLTEAGERFLERARPAYEELIAAAATVRDLGGRPSGLLRLTAPKSVVPILLEPLIASFCAAYPDIEVEISASAELVDIAANGFDAGVRMGRFIAPDMVAVPLSPPLRLIIVGSPNYFARRAKPKGARDLREQACIRLRRSSGALAPWSLLENGRPVDISVSGPFIANDYPTVIGAAVEGVGLAQVPEPTVAALLKTGALVAVLDKLAPTTPGVALYYPGRRQILPKLRAFIDHIRQRAP